MKNTIKLLKAAMLLGCAFGYEASASVVLDLGTKPAQLQRQFTQEECMQLIPNPADFANFGIEAVNAKQYGWSFTRCMTRELGTRCIEALQQGQLTEIVQYMPERIYQRLLGKESCCSKEDAVFIFDNLLTGALKSEAGQAPGFLDGLTQIQQQLNYILMTAPREGTNDTCFTLRRLGQFKETLDLIPGNKKFFGEDGRMQVMYNIQDVLHYPYDVEHKIALLKKAIDVELQVW